MDRRTSSSVFKCIKSYRLLLHLPRMNKHQLRCIRRCPSQEMEQKMHRRQRTTGRKRWLPRPKSQSTMPTVRTQASGKRIIVHQTSLIHFLHNILALKPFKVSLIDIFLTYPQYIVTVSCTNNYVKINRIRMKTF